MEIPQNFVVFSELMNFTKNITCRYTKKNLGATDYGFVDIYPSGDEQALKAAVATVGKNFF